MLHAVKENLSERITAILTENEDLHSENLRLSEETHKAVSLHGAWYKQRLKRLPVPPSVSGNFAHGRGTLNSFPPGGLVTFNVTK